MGVVGAWLQSQKDQTDGEMLLYLASRLPFVDAKKPHRSFTVEFLIARLRQERIKLRCWTFDVTKDRSRNLQACADTLSNDIASKTYPRLTIRNDIFQSAVDHQ